MRPDHNTGREWLGRGQCFFICEKIIVFRENYNLIKVNGHSGTIDFFKNILLKILFLSNVNLAGYYTAGLLIRTPPIIKKVNQDLENFGK